MSMKFTKMHGIGNDYVYVDCFSQSVPDPSRTAIAISNRNFGVGSDGLILIEPSKIADVKMRMFNADGGESEMCGNGVRCVAKYAFDHGLSRSNPMRIETGRGVLTLSLQVEAGKVQRASVDMGEPILEAAKIPCTISAERIVNHPLRALNVATDPRNAWFEEAGVEAGVTCVSMGNPHLVMFCKNVDEVPLERVGPMFERAPVFPKRINVHFAQRNTRDEVKMRTWERGTGITLACGTGACAVCVAGAITDRTNRIVLAHLPGGDLQLEWRESDNHVFKTGPATEVFSGEWNEKI